ncbi:MAG: hypothetical protein EZS28_015341 [Streblomastix strix]|uniref:RanBP2-type domain-containing protein n=1 Tax=Streblomastix strix TaxID=222440 RepID=A0A5J4W390_9EUKA|nr:MAG: hypothetical protein EZS28_015341 [Streblomastix strix]
MERPGDWRCSACGTSNFAWRVLCFRCHVPRPGATPADIANDQSQFRPQRQFGGEWICQQCRSTNYSQRTDCYQCGAPRPQFGGNEGGFSGGFGGGFNGGFRNGYGSGFGYRRYQRRFGGFNPFRRPRRFQQRAGDWFCGSCQTHNFAFRGACRQCQNVKDGSARVVTEEEIQQRQNQVRPGDWICPSCQTNNFAFRTECFKCRTPKQ